MEHDTAHMFGILARFRVVTPMYLGGASQQAELRAPSIKAMLRIWHRAVDPGFFGTSSPGEPIRESVLWGGTERHAGQSKALLAITEQELHPFRWGDVNWNRFNEGEGRQRKNGAAYLGYPFASFREHRDRTGFAPGSTFALRIALRPRVQLDEWEPRAIAASLWALGHLGALGSRSRRGFGAISLVDWRTFGACPTDWRATIEALPLLTAHSGRDAWTEAFGRVRATFRSWFGDFAGLDCDLPHPHLGPKTRVAISTKAFAVAQWPEALNSLGRTLQDFRVRRQPDYDIAKNHLLAAARAGGSPMRSAPGRVTFGLPLAFRFGSLQTRPTELTLVPFDGELKKERHPSVLLARLVQTAAGLHPLFLRLSGAVPGMDGQRVGDRNAPRQNLLAVEHSLDKFMDTVE